MVPDLPTDHDLRQLHTPSDRIIALPTSFVLKKKKGEKKKKKKETPQSALAPNPHGQTKQLSCMVGVVAFASGTPSSGPLSSPIRGSVSGAKSPLHGVIPATAKKAWGAWVTQL